MPIYEYECEKCGNTTERLQDFSDRPMTKCPHCSGKVHKLISRSAFHLKGSGWYVTDYSKKSSGNASSSEKASKDSGSSTGKKAAGGSDSASDS